MNDDGLCLLPCWHLQAVSQS